MPVQSNGPERDRFIVGILLVIVGGLFLLSNVGYIDIGPIWEFWPLIIVYFGIRKMLSADRSVERTEGAWYVFIGIWLFVSLYDAFGLSIRTTWPVLLVGWGISILLKSMQGYSSERRHRHAG